MFEFMRLGGWGMWFILLLGGAAVAIAGSYARRPEERKLALIRPLSVATVFAVLASMAAGLGNAVHYIAVRPEITGDEIWRTLFSGLYELLRNPILGFGLLMAAWMLAAVGLHRRP
jgi:protein-S-isoprenylcysteine O-methyltransferase Ste14